MSCNRQLLNLCDVSRIQLKDGQAGANAKIYVPFLGFVRADGATMTFPGSTIPQDKSRFFAGATKVSTFQKDCCSL